MVLVCAMCLGAKAQNYQHVAPINIPVEQFNLDSMRYGLDNDELYLTSLQALQHRLQDEKKVISAAQKGLKAEQNIYKAQMSLLKDRKKQISKEKKFLQGQIKQYNAYIKNTSRQKEAIGRTEAQCPALQEHLNMVNSIREWAIDSKTHAEEQLVYLNQYDDSDITNAYVMLGDFLFELKDKETRLTNLAAQNKTNLAMVKAQIKNIKAQVKAAKKK